MRIVLSQSAKFNPYSFERLLQPYAMYTQEYNAVEEGITELKSKAELMKQYALQEPDSKAANMYNAYANELDAQANELAKNGLKAVNRSNLLNLKSQYNSSIAPIEIAVARHKELAEEQRKLSAADDTLIYDNDYNSLGIDYLLDNPNASYTSLSGANITKRTAVMAKQAAEAIVSNPEYSSVYNSQYVQQKIKQGYSMEEIIATAKRDPNAPKALLSIVNSIKDQVQYNNWSDDNKAIIDDYINEGLMAAAETSKIEVMANKAFITEQEKERIELQNELTRAQIEEAKGTELPGGGKIVKLGGGKFVQYDAEGNIVLTNASFDSDKETTEEKEEAKLRAKATVDHEVALKQARKVSEITELGYTPMVAVVNDNNSWNYGEQGDSFPREGWGTKSNLGTSWGNYSLHPKDENAETSIVSLDQIPGFRAFESEGILEANSAWESIFEMGLEKGLIKTATIEYSKLEKGMVQVSQPRQEDGVTKVDVVDFNKSPLFSDKIQIAQVKARRSRGRNNEYDYLVFRKNN